MIDAHNGAGRLEGQKLGAGIGKGGGCGCQVCQLGTMTKELRIVNFINGGNL